jgi:hypothetical protein
MYNPIQQEEEEELHREFFNNLMNDPDDIPFASDEEAKTYIGNLLRPSKTEKENEKDS